MLNRSLLQQPFPRLDIAAATVAVNCLRQCCCERFKSPKTVDMIAAALQNYLYWNRKKALHSTTVRCAILTGPSVSRFAWCRPTEASYDHGRTAWRRQTIGQMYLFTIEYPDADGQPLKKRTGAASVLAVKALLRTISSAASANNGGTARC